MKKLIALLAALLLSFPVLADPPGRVGRISSLSGNVSLYADAEDDWQPAQLNWPITSQNSLWTDIDGRAEVRVGAVSVRLDGGTQADFRLLDDVALDIFVPRGSLGVRLSRTEKSERYIVSTPEARFYLSANGRYRIDADSDRGESKITVFSGSAQLDTPNSQINVEPGKAMRIKVANGQVDFRFEVAALTQMDQWALQRDEQFREAERMLAPREISPQMTGYEDLNNNGTWAQEPEYGTVWYPNVAASWVPYRYGRWSYVRPWGWTWIDDAPWGFAPFHYGRWVQVGSRWGWYPGRYVARPCYAPALVTWIGGSGWNVGVSVGGPAIGWLPLGPRDYYRPWYGHSNVYINNINNVTYVNNGRPFRPTPQSQPHGGQRPGATVVLQEQFAGRPIGNAALRVSGETIANAPVLGANTALPPRAAMTKPVRVERANPAPVVSGQPAQNKPAVAGQPAYNQGTPAASVTQPTSRPGRPPQQVEARPVVSGTPATTPVAPNYEKPARQTRDAQPQVRQQVPPQVQQQGESARQDKPVSNRALSQPQVRQVSPQVQQAPQQALQPVPQQGGAPVHQQQQQQPVQRGAPVVVQPQAVEKAPAVPKPAEVDAPEPVGKPSGNRQAR